MQAIGHIGDFFVQQQEARSKKKAKRDEEAAKSIDTIVREQIRGSNWQIAQQKLAENDINSFDALINLSDNDIDLLGLSIGHKGMLRGYIRSMREAQLFRSCLFQLSNSPPLSLRNSSGHPHPGAEAGTLFAAFPFLSAKSLAPQSDGGGRVDGRVDGGGWCACENEDCSTTFLLSLTGRGSAHASPPSPAPSARSARRRTCAAFWGRFPSAAA